ncbi:MAG: DUF502 domain-containing protein [Bacteroidetes bacterium]|nr:DUF502 domain-containing protein [Bacteroidota bacterium]
MKKILTAFFQGLIVFIPSIITLFVLLQLFNFFTNIFSIIGLSENQFINTSICLVLTIVFITLLGWLTGNYFFKNIFSLLEDKLENAPLIKHIYSPIKDFTNAFIGNKKKFNKPVLVLTNPQANIEEIGFITRENLSDLTISDKVAVYIPMSYSISGRLIIVPTSQVKPLDTEASEVMKFIVTGGVSEID